MRKLKAGEWFNCDGMPAILVTTTPDGDGDYRIAYDLGAGQFSSNWLFSGIDNREILKRERWKSFRSAMRRDDDGYEDYRFYAFYSPNGKRALIVAGCRAFTIAQAKAHWAPGNPDHSASESDTFAARLSRSATGLRRLPAAVRAKRCAGSVRSHSAGCVCRHEIDSRSSARDHR